MSIVKSTIHHSPLTIDHSPSPLTIEYNPFPTKKTSNLTNPATLKYPKFYLTQDYN